VVIEPLVVPALYEANVSHSRRSPMRHDFRYRVAYWLVDFDRLPYPRGVAGRCIGVSQEDHIDIRSFLLERGITAARVVMLSGARILGHAFDPISVFWCYDQSGTQCAVVAEVHNTYGGRHGYLLNSAEEDVAQVPKRMYVSPFNRVDGTYHIRVSSPGSTVSVSVSLERVGQEPFTAILCGTRRPMTMIAVVGSMFRVSGARTRLLIQWEALRLWRRGLTVQPR
jgi:uncharacterized protein